MIPRPVSPVVLSPDLTATEALDVIVRAAGDHVSRHVELLRTERDPESLHQVRIGARRARVAISLLRRPLGDGEKLAWVSTEIRDLGVPLGRARDLDVAVRDHAADLHGTPRERLLERRSAAWDEVLEVIDSDRWNDLRTHIDVLLRHLHEEVPLDPPVLDAADAALERRYRRVLRGGADLARGSRAERHAVRNEAKKLRYGVQFFTSLYAGRLRPAGGPGSAPSEFERGATDLQDALGDLGDQETSHHLLELVGARHPAPDKTPHLERAASAVEHLEELEPFWGTPVG